MQIFLVLLCWEQKLRLLAAVLIHATGLVRYPSGILVELLASMKGLQRLLEVQNIDNTESGCKTSARDKQMMT